MKKFKGYLRIDFVDLPNNELGTKTLTTEDWLVKRKQITKKPRTYYVSSHVKLMSGSTITTRLTFTTKTNKEDIKPLMMKAFELSTQNLDEPVDLFNSYLVVTV